MTTEYYNYKGTTLCTDTPLPYEKISSLPGTGEVVYLFRRAPLTGRDSFAVTSPADLTALEGVDTLDANAPAPGALPADLSAAIAAGRVRAANAAHPRWEELLTPPAGRRRLRLHLLALGDVGSTLAIGLRLLGADALTGIGICDVRPGVAPRWEFELNQIALPGDPDAFPPVEVVDADHIFDCDVFLFCASLFVPDTEVKSGDVRMAQYEKNKGLVSLYARMARDRHYRGLFCVVSDPVDPLCRAALLASNRNEAGELDYRGLFPHQVRGFGLGVMNARAAYYAKKEGRFADFLVDGRTFGPHGEGLIVANSVSRYDNGLSVELTEMTKRANLALRELGYKPYVAPALSSGALSVLLCLRGEWHCSSVFLNGVFFGVRNRLTARGIEIERVPLAEELRTRILETMDQLKSID